MTRYNAVEAMFGSSRELIILSNPFLLTLICTFIFQSSVKIRPKSRIEICYHVVQATLHSWKNQRSSISKSMLINVLLELAMYLQLQSPSGLIDGFDMRQLCCLTLQRQNLSNNRTKLREYAEEFLLLLNSNVGIVAERSLQVFVFFTFFISRIFCSTIIHPRFFYRRYC